MSCANCSCPKKNNMISQNSCHQNIILTEEENGFLEILKQYLYLPVVKFVLKDEAGAELKSLSPIFISDINQTFDEVENNAKILYYLENKGVISIDYDIKLEGANYAEYKNSVIYNEFCCSEKDKMAVIEYGSIALTCKGEKLLK